jgi:hypothetical protein
MHTATVTPTNYVEVEKFPKPGDVIVLPAGLRYFNQFYGSKHTTRFGRPVTVTSVERDEIFWTIPGDTPNGETCYARWRRSRP